MNRCAAVFAAVAGACLCLAAYAASLDSVTPSSGSLGTHFSIVGSGFGTKKPKVTLAVGKTKALVKVDSFSDTQVDVTLTKATFAATYDVTVTPAGKGAAPLTRMGAFGVNGPDAVSVSPANPQPGGTVTITGADFGVKKGKVVVGTKTAKVTAWTDTSITVVLSKKHPTGGQDVTVTNTVSSDRLPAALDVGGTNATPVNETAVLRPSDVSHNVFLGRSIAVGTNYVALGAPNRVAGTTGNVQRGAAYVYAAIGTGSVTEEQILTRTNGNETDQAFGSDLTFAGDTLVVGSYGYSDGANTSSGAAYVFKRGASVWSKDQDLLPADPAVNGLYGIAVAGSGNRLVVGAPNAMTASVATGAVYAYTRNDASSQWTLDERFGPATDVGAFGIRLALDGSTAVVSNGSAANSAQVWARGASTWASQGTLTVKNGNGSEGFGASVALSGDTAIVGATGEASGRGGAYVFVRSGATWTQQAHLVPAGAGPGDGAGKSVAIVGNTAVVGAQGGASRAYVFRRTGTTWTQGANLVPIDGSFIGPAAAADAARLFVGAPDASSPSGAVFVFPAN